MKQNGAPVNRTLKLRQKTEQMLAKSASALKKISATEFRNLLEDLQIYQIELEQQNKSLLKMQESLKRTTLALKQSEMRYRTLFHESREAKSLSKNGKIVEVNPRWLELHGYDDKNEVLGKDILQFIHEEDRKILQGRRKRWPQKMEAVYELRDVRRDGSIVNVEVYSSRISIDGEDAILATIHDISDRKRLEEQRQKLKKMEALSTLSGGIAQHFNNALSAINAYTEILEMDFSDNDRIMRCVNPMKQATDRMADLTAQLLAGGFGGRYSPEALCINDFVNTVLLSMKRNIPDTIHLTVTSAPDLPTVVADPSQVNMALSAVIENAVEAVEENGIIDIRCLKEILNEPYKSEHATHQPGTYVCLRVNDNGKGMDPEILERVYDPFFTTHFTGRGLGLSAAYGIIRNHDGFIRIESKPGRGTALHIYLPAAPEH